MIEWASQVSVQAVWYTQSKTRPPSKAGATASSSWVTGPRMNGGCGSSLASLLLRCNAPPFHLAPALYQAAQAREESNSVSPLL